ncbi:hypothetical protein C8R46DRAFT_1319225 [Mycena filopes]|nr:hypothetical protein C8R46DRAFT_1319225 [Mycena filopes]
MPPKPQSGAASGPAARTLRSGKNTPTAPNTRLPVNTTPARTTTDAGPTVGTPTPAPTGTLRQEPEATAAGSASTQTQPEPEPVVVDNLPRVRSPTPQSSTSVPFAAMVVASATTFTAPTPLPTGAVNVLDPVVYPPLPPAGDEVMTQDVPAERKDKGKAREVAPADSPFVAPATSRRPSLSSTFGAHDEPPAGEGILSPIEDNTGVLGVPAQTNPRPDHEDPHFMADYNTALARSLIPADAPTNTTAGASTSKRRSEEPESPSKRPRSEEGEISSARVTRASAREAAGSNRPRNTQPNERGTREARPTPAPANEIPTTTRVSTTTTATQQTASATPLRTARSPPRSPSPYEGGFMTEDGRPPRIPITPTPEGGWPLVTGVDREVLMDPVDKEQTGEWEEEEAEGPTSLAFRMGGSLDPVSDSRALAAAAEGTVNAEPGSARVGAGVAAVEGARPPNVFIIAGLSAFAHRALQEQLVISTANGTFVILPPHPNESGYMGTVVDLAFENTPEGAIGAADVIRRCATKNMQFVQLVQTHRDGVPRNYSIQEIADELRDSITVQPIEITNTLGTRIGWRVYSIVTTRIPAAYRLIRAAFRKTRLVTGFSYRGVVRADMSCAVCRGIDHPTGLCPFPLVPGWMGPSEATIAAAAQAARAAAAAARNRGTRRGGRAGFNGANRGFRGGRGRGF